MRSIPSKMLFSVLVVCACSVVVVASASASEFVFSKTGSLKGSALNTQKFKTSVGTWECSKEKISGSVTALKTATQKVTVQYEACALFGISLKASPAEYELNTNGTFKVLKAFSMKSFGEECTINFPAQTLSKDTYANKPAGKIEIASEVAKITSSGSGSFCHYTEGSNGVLEGNSLLELEGGTAEVK